MTLSLLASTSILGTFIPQKKSAQWYAQEYGDALGQIFAVFNVGDMYHSWWFLGLLGILCTNLIICSLERFPGVWKQIRANGLDLPTERLERMGMRKVWRSRVSLPATVSTLRRKLKNSNWKISRRDTDNQILLFAQRGAYSRAGVYIVHASVLIIFFGAIIGELYGFKGTVVIPVTDQTDKIFAAGGEVSIDLGFSVRCDAFAIELYPSGKIKNYRSELTVLESGKEVAQASIGVNAPLTYQGVSFYQSDYEGYNEFMIQLTNTGSGKSKTLILPFQAKQGWQDEGVSFGIINEEVVGKSVVRIKMWFSDGQGSPITRWLNEGGETVVEGRHASYLFSVKQMYATGLQVSYDPGVWIVYLGFVLMILGLLLAFFLSHKRIWFLLRREGEETIILFVGSANKNRSGFDKQFNALATTLQQEDQR